MPAWVGHYINLDRSPARRASIERQLAIRGLSSLYSRFTAIDGSRLAPVPGLTPAELGCARSHSELLLAITPKARFVHILEDDAILSTNFVDVLDNFIESNYFDEFDIIFTDVFPFDTSPASVRKLKSAYDLAMSGETPRFRLIDLRGFAFGGSNSYLINTKSLRKVLMAVNGGVLRGQKPEPVDLLLRREINSNALRAVCVFPFISAVDLGFGQDSTIDNRDHLLVNNLFRHAFYVDCDFSALNSFIAPLIAPPETDKHMDLLADIFRLSVGAGAPGKTPEEATIAALSRAAR